MRVVAVLLGVVLAACGSAQPTSERYVIGNYAISGPSSWKVQTEPDENGFHVVEPPSGQGRLVLLEIHDKQSPTIDEAYALEHAQRGITSAGLSATNLSPRQLSPSHFVTTAEGIGGGEHVVAAVHVFAPGEIVIGYFHTPDASDPVTDAARQILESVTPTSP